MKLSKLQISAVRHMAKGIKPLENKLETLAVKREKAVEKIDEQMEEISSQIAQIHEAISSFTGGMSLTEVLTPEAVPTDSIGEEVPSEETAEEVDVTAFMRENVQEASEV